MVGLQLLDAFDLLYGRLLAPCLHPTSSPRTLVLTVPTRPNITRRVNAVAHWRQDFNVFFDHYNQRDALFAVPQPPNGPPDTTTFAHTLVRAISHSMRRGSFYNALANFQLAALQYLSECSVSNFFFSICYFATKRPAQNRPAKELVKGMADHQ
jgi:hypothetical protein